MAVSCGYRCLKILVVLLNLIVLLSGAVLLAGGIWLKHDPGVVSYIQIMRTAHTAPLMDVASVILIGVGCFLLGVGLLGCLGTCCESHCLLCLHSMVLFLAIIAEIGGGIAVAVLKDKINVHLETEMYKQVHWRYNRSQQANHESSVDSLTLAWDIMQIDLECCGARGPKDYIKSYWYNRTRFEGVTDPLPKTCCVLNNKDAVHPDVAEPGRCHTEAVYFSSQVHRGPSYSAGTSIPPQSFHSKGCYHRLLDWVRENHVAIIGFACGFGALQVMGLILACCMMAAIRRKGY